MANVIRIKNSGTANSAPTSLELGELAINYNDGKIFYKNSSNAIVQFGSSGGSGGVTVSDTPPSSPSAGDLWYESDTGKSFVYYDSFWVEIGAGSGVGLDSIVLGDDTTGNYVASLVAGTGVTLSNNSGEATTPTIAVDTSAIQVRVTNVSDTEIGYLDGVTSAIQTQIDAKASSNSSPVITLSGDLSGSATLTNLGNATITATIVANSVALGSDTSGDYVQSLVAGTGITLSNNSGEGTTPTVAVNTSTIATLASPIFTGDVTVSNNLIVSGNLTVSGSTTTVNTETVTIDDNIIVLNNNVTGSPTENAGVEIERGTSTNVQLRWNETTDKWQFTNDGTNFTDLGAGGATISETAPNSPIGGQIWFNSDSGGTYVYYGSAWVEVGAAPVNVMLQAIDAKGDLLIGTADNTVGKVSVGSNSQLLRANSSTATGVEWFTPSYAPAASPTFTGTVVLPSDTSIGNVSSTEIGYVDGVTSAIQTQLDSKLTATTAVTSNRNAIINGSMNVWQRGTTVQTNTGQGAYAADRWCGAHQFQNSRTQRTSISSPPSGLLSQYALRSSSSTTAQSANGTRMRIAQKLESLNSYKLRGQQVTLSFWVRFSNATVSSISNAGGGGDSAYGNFGYSIGSYTSTTDSATNTSAADAATNATITNGSLPTTWTKYTLTGTISSTANNVDVVFGFSSLGSTTSADTEWFELAQIQLEAGAVATPFEFEDYGTTFAKCQRYFETQDWTINTFRLAVVYATSGPAQGYFMFTPKRVTPTFSWSGNGSARYIYQNGNATGSQTLSTSYSSYNGSSFATSSSFAYTTGWVDNAGTLSISAEL